jgi:hypothetical protein
LLVWRWFSLGSVLGSAQNTIVLVQRWFGLKNTVNSSCFCKTFSVFGEPPTSRFLGDETLALEVFEGAVHGAFVRAVAFAHVRSDPSGSA